MRIMELKLNDVEKRTIIKTINNYLVNEADVDKEIQNEILKALLIAPEKIKSILSLSEKLHQGPIDQKDFLRTMKTALDGILTTALKKQLSMSHEGPKHLNPPRKPS